MKVLAIVDSEGSVFRAVEEDGVVRSEIWDGSEFVPGGTLRDVLVGRELSVEEVAERGILLAVDTEPNA